MASIEDMSSTVNLEGLTISDNFIDSSIATVDTTAEDILLMAPSQASDVLPTPPQQVEVASNANIAEYEQLLSSISKAQSIIKEEQQAPDKRSPLSWRQETCRELNHGLQLVEQVMSNQLVLKNRKLVEGELFNALETLFVLCVDDGGTGGDDVASRLKKVSSIIEGMLSVKVGKASLFKPPQMRLLSSIHGTTQPLESVADSADVNTNAYSTEALKMVSRMCELSFESLVATPDRLVAIEKVRQEVYDRLSTNPKFLKEFRGGGGLDIFGSSVATLASPSSDVDLCLRLPGLSRHMDAKRKKFEEAKRERNDLESTCPVMDEVRCLVQLSPKFNNTEVSLASRTSKVKKRKDNVACAKRELANAKAAGEKEKVSRSGDKDDKSAEKDTAQKRNETKLANKVNTEENYLRDARKKLDEAEKEMKKLHSRKASLSSTAIAKFPALLDFTKRLESLQKVERAAHNGVLEAGKIVFAVSSTIHSTNGYPALPQRAFQVVGRARVPVVKATEKALGIAFDVVVNNEIALRNSLLLAAYASDPRARQLMFLTKAWAKANRLNEAPNGTPSSYCHALLVVFYLMQTPQDIAEMMGKKHIQRACSPILPNLQSLPRLASVVVDGLETKFEPDLARAKQEIGDNLPVDSRGGPELLVGYFKWLAWLLKNAAHWCVSVKTGKLLGDKHLKWHNGKRWRLSVEDPFETIDSHRPHDLGQVVTNEGQRRLLSACLKTAALEQALCKGTSNIEAWNSFLGLKIKKSKHTKNNAHAGAAQSGGVSGVVSTGGGVGGGSVSAGGGVSGGGSGGGGVSVSAGGGGAGASGSKGSILSRLGPRTITSRLGPQVLDYNGAMTELVFVLQAEVAKVGRADEGVVDIDVASFMGAFKLRTGFAFSKTQWASLAGGKGRMTKPTKLLESMTKWDFTLNDASVSVRFDSARQTTPKKKELPQPAKVSVRHTKVNPTAVVPSTRHGAANEQSEEELLKVIEDLFSDGTWANLATIKTRFYTATECKLRPALFSGRPLEQVISDIPSLRFSEGNNGNSNPRWRYQGEVTKRSSTAPSTKSSPSTPASAQTPVKGAYRGARNPRPRKERGKGGGVAAKETNAPSAASE